MVNAAVQSFPLTLVSNGSRQKSAVVVNGSFIPQSEQQTPFYGLAAIIVGKDNQPQIVFHQTFDPTTLGFPLDFSSALSDKILSPYQSHSPIVLVWTQALDWTNWSSYQLVLDTLEKIGGGPILQDLNQKATTLPACVGELSYCLVNKANPAGIFEDSTNEKAGTGYLANANLTLSLIALELANETVFEIRELD